MSVVPERTDGAPLVVLTPRTVRVIFGALMAGTVLSSLDRSILGTAMPRIVGELDGVEHQGWLVAAHVLAVAIVLPLYGKFGDLWSRRYAFWYLVPLVPLVAVDLAPTLFLREVPLPEVAGMAAPGEARTSPGVHSRSRRPRLPLPRTGPRAGSLTG